MKKSYFNKVFRFWFVYPLLSCVFLCLVSEANQILVRKRFESSIDPEWFKKPYLKQEWIQTTKKKEILEFQSFVGPMVHVMLAVLFFAVYLQYQVELKKRTGIPYWKKVALSIRADYYLSQTIILIAALYWSFCLLKTIPLWLTMLIILGFAFLNKLFFAWIYRCEKKNTTVREWAEAGFPED